MRIAISADSEAGLESAVSSHFGRCPYFVLVDVDKGIISRVDTMQNPFFGEHKPGQVPNFIHGQKANVMLSGGMGAGAISMFDQYRIEVATGARGSVREAVEGYLKGTLQGVEICCPDDHGHH